MNFRKTDEIFSRASEDAVELEKLIKRFKSLRSTSFWIFGIAICSLIAILIYASTLLGSIWEVESSGVDIESQMDWILPIAGMLGAVGFLTIGCSVDADHRVKMLLLKKSPK